MFLVFGTACGFKLNEVLLVDVLKSFSNVGCCPIFWDTRVLKLSSNELNVREDWKLFSNDWEVWKLSPVRRWAGGDVKLSSNMCVIADGVEFVVALAGEFDSFPFAWSIGRKSSSNGLVGAWVLWGPDCIGTSPLNAASLGVCG